MASVSDNPTSEQPLDNYIPNQPLDGSSPKQPLDGSSTKQPLDGSSPKQPLDGSSSKQPLDGSSPKQPLDGSYELHSKYLPSELSLTRSNVGVSTSLISTENSASKQQSTTKQPLDGSTPQLSTTLLPVKTPPTYTRPPCAPDTPNPAGHGTHTLPSRLQVSSEMAVPSSMCSHLFESSPSCSTVLKSSPSPVRNPSPVRSPSPVRCLLL